MSLSETVPPCPFNVFSRFPSDHFALVTECWIECLIQHTPFVGSLFVGKLFLIVQQGPWSWWLLTTHSALIMPQWQRVLGQGSRAVRSLCHTSLQAGHGQPLAQLGVLKTQGNAANLQGCLPWLFSNQLCLTEFVRLCLAVAWWNGGCVGVTVKLTKQHDGTFVGSLKRRSHQKSSLCVLEVMESAGTLYDVQYIVKYCKHGDMTENNEGSHSRKITCITSENEVMIQLCSQIILIPPGPLSWYPLSVWEPLFYMTKLINKHSHLFTDITLPLLPPTGKANWWKWWYVVLHLYYSNNKTNNKMCIFVFA